MQYSGMILEIRNSVVKLKKYGERLNYNPILEGFTLPKMLWVQQHEPEIWEQVNVFMLPKDYLRYCLTNQINMEYSDAASTLLLNPKTNFRTKDVGSIFNIPDIYPSLVNSHECVGYVSELLADESRFKASGCCICRRWG